MDDTSPATAAESAAGDGPFDAYYFAHCCGRPYARDEHWLGFFGAIADRIAADIRPGRVLDAGCALGILVETLRARGVEAEGIDLSSYAIEHAHESVRPFCRQGSITDEFPARYDLIVTIEVLEHIPPPGGEAAIANICRHTDDVLFSSSPSDHREPSHVNVQPAEYWAEQFARHGFFRDVDFDATFLTPWAVRFRKRDEPVHRIVRDYERQYAHLAASSYGARSFAADLQRDLDAAERRIATLETERVAMDQAQTALRASLEETHAHLTRKIVAMQALEERVHAAEARVPHLEHEVGQARATIAQMESSIFWRLRGVWARVSRALGRPT